MPNYTTREFRDSDYEPLTEIGNREHPPHRQNSAESWQRMDARREPQEVFIKIVVPDPDTDKAIAYLSATDLNTSPGKFADVCGFGIQVAHAHRRQGIGAMLYELALEFAEKRGSKRLVTGFIEHTPDEPAIGFLTKRGFDEQERERPSHLNLADFDLAPFVREIAEAEKHVRIISYADVPDTEENRRKIYDLFVPIIYDIPRRDTQPFEMDPFETWQKWTIERPEWNPSLMLLTEAPNGDWVGLTHIMPKLENTVGMQWLTGVHKDWRGRSIATALKARSYANAKAQDRTIIITENHEDNGPMLAVNTKFGFVPDAPEVRWNKVLA